MPGHLDYSIVSFFGERDWNVQKRRLCSERPCSAMLGAPAGASVLTLLSPSPCREERAVPQLPSSPPPSHSQGSASRVLGLSSLWKTARTAGHSKQWFSSRVTLPTPRGHNW